MERTGWWFRIESLLLLSMNNYPGCAFGAATPPGQEGQSAFFSQVCLRPYQGG